MTLLPKWIDDLGRIGAGGVGTDQRNGRGGMNFGSKCVGCGRFMGANDFIFGRCDYEPLSEFGPERIEWTCRRCAQGMPSEGPRRECGSGASAPASPVPKECAQHQSKDSTP